MSRAVFDAARASDIAALLADAAAAEVLSRFRALGASGVRTKSGPLDLVTDADEAAERRIVEGLKHRFPGCVVVGEEAAAAEPALLGQLADADLAFLVDPVDGTANFVVGIPLFGTMAAALVRGEIVAAWIHDPIGGGDTCMALRGEGAWRETASGARSDLRVAAPAATDHLIAAISWGFMPEPLKSRVTARLPQLAAVVGFRCAAHEYRLAAAGHLHLLVYSRLMPWDHAPGWLLHREAGGFAAQFDGEAYSPLVHEGGLMSAPSREVWEAARETLQLRHL
jgi:fructose-1,6-bisphosphatase/inositol monophosphatase family enzyme